MNNNKVSIIVPVYNVEDLLTKCVDSIIDQTHKNIEIILVNDGSKDNSGTICDEYDKKFDFIKTVHQENAGQSAARNFGLKFLSSNYDYLMFIDSDDWIELNMIETLLYYLNRNNAEVVECDLSYSNLKDTPTTFNEENYPPLIETKNEALKRIINNQRFSVCVRLYKRNVVDGIKFVEGKNAPDVYYTSEVFNRTNKNVYINFPFYKYYYNPESITKKPYTLKKLDSLDAALFVKDNIKTKDKELKQVIASNLLYASLYHYKYINYYNELDKDWEVRKRLKGLINSNYSEVAKSTFQTKIARYLPIRIFYFILSINRSRTNIVIR